MKTIMMGEAHGADSIENDLRGGADGYLIKPVARRSGGKDSRRETEHSRASLRTGSNLTPRENVLMKYFAQGLLYKEAADKLGTSYAVVHKLQHSIFVKLHVSNRTEAISNWRAESGRLDG